MAGEFWKDQKSCSGKMLSEERVAAAERASNCGKERYEINVFLCKNATVNSWNRGTDINTRLKAGEFKGKWICGHSKVKEIQRKMDLWAQ